MNNELFSISHFGREAQQLSLAIQQMRTERRAVTTDAIQSTVVDPLTEEQVSWAPAMLFVDLPASPDFETDEHQQQNEPNVQLNQTNLSNEEVLSRMRAFRDRLNLSGLKTIQFMRTLSQSVHRCSPDGITRRLAGAWESSSQMHQQQQTIISNRLVLRLSIHQPSLKGSPWQCIEVLDDCSLGSLRQLIYCPTDRVTSYLCRIDPQHHITSLEQMEERRRVAMLDPIRYGSAQFCFESVIFEHQSHCTVTRPSVNATNQQSFVEVLGEAALHKGLVISHPQILDADQSRMTDLPPLRLAQPYAFVHGSTRCLHFILIDQVRLYSPIHDLAVLECYPKEIQRLSFRRRKCALCDLMRARWLAVGDPLAPESPCAFCSGCLEALHGDPERPKELLLPQETSIYPYFHEWQ